MCEYEIDGISDFVFLNRFGQPQNPQTVNRAIKRISVAYNEAELEKRKSRSANPNCCRLSPAIISGTRSAPGCAKMRPT